MISTTFGGARNPRPKKGGAGHDYTSVSSVYQIALTRDKPLTEWIDYLRTKAEPAEGYMLTKMKSEYKILLRQFKGIKNIVAWLDNWEKFIAKASRYNMPELDTGNWLLDLSNLIEPIHQTYATSFPKRSYCYSPKP